MQSHTLELPNARHTMALGGAFFYAGVDVGVIYLHGELGAGKSTWVRGLLRASGFTGAIKSPTYTYLYDYPYREHSLYHYDLYRLADPEEVNLLGVRDQLATPCLQIFEWPAQGGGELPPPDLELTLQAPQASQSGRQASWQVHTERARAWTANLALNLTQQDMDVYGMDPLD